MLPLSRISMFINCSSVKISKTMRIFREMSRNPVQNDADAVLMKIIHHILEIFRRSISGCRCKISSYLIAPGTVKGMLCDSHQFHMGISHILHICRQLFRQFSIIIEAILILFMGMTFPGTRMHFIDGQCFLCTVPCLSFLHPAFVMPGEVADICHSGCRTRTFLRIRCKRICFVKIISTLRLNQIFIHTAFPESRNKHFVNSQWVQTFHRISVVSPAVEFPNYAHTLCMGCPYCKINSLFAVILRRMRTQLLIYLIVCAFPEQILIHVCNHAPWPFYSSFTD